MIHHLPHARTSTLGLLAFALASTAATALMVPPLVPTSLLSSTPTQGNANRIATKGRYAFVATYYGLEIFNIGTPSNPVALGSVATPGDAYDIEVSATTPHVYIADLSGGVQIIDVSNVMAPVIVDNLSAASLGGPTNGVELDGDRLYTFSGGGGIRIFDVATNPADPTEIGDYTPFGTLYSNDGVARGSMLCVADGLLGAMVFDVSNPATPTLVAQSNVGIAQDPAVLGEAFVTVAQGLIRTVSVAPPIQNPLQLLDSGALPSSLNLEVDAAVESDGSRYAYAATTAGCSIWLIDPLNAITLDETLLPGQFVSGVTYSRGLLLLSRGPNGFQIYLR